MTPTPFVDPAWQLAVVEDLGQRGFASVIETTSAIARIPASLPICPRITDDQQELLARAVRSALR